MLQHPLLVAVQHSQKMLKRTVNINPYKRSGKAHPRWCESHEAVDVDREKLGRRFNQDGMKTAALREQVVSWQQRAGHSCEDDQAPSTYKGSFQES